MRARSENRRVTFRLPLSLKEAVHKHAKKEGISVSELTCRAIRKQTMPAAIAGAIATVAKEHGISPAELTDSIISGGSSQAIPPIDKSKMQQIKKRISRDCDLILKRGSAELIWELNEGIDWLFEIAVAAKQKGAAK